MLYQYDPKHIYHNFITTVTFPCFDFIIHYAELMNESIVEFEHHHNLYEAYYGMSGTAVFSCNGQTVPLHEDGVIMLGQNQRHHMLYNPERAATYFVLIFDIIPKSSSSTVEDNMEFGEIAELLVQLDRDKFRYACGGDSQKPLLNRIENEMTERCIGWNSIIGTLFYHFLVHLLRQVFPVPSRVQTPSGHKNIALTASKYIHSNYKDEITTDMVAKELCVTPRHINRLFQDMFGHPFAQTVNIIRMEYAKQYLHATNLSVESIATRVGLPSGKVLTKLFNEREGISPAKYRAVYRQQIK